MQGHIVHYEANIEKLLRDVREQHPDLVVIDTISSLDQNVINSIVHVYGHLIVRGEISLEKTDPEEMKNVILVPSWVSNESLVEKIGHLYESEKVTGIAPVKILIIEDNTDILEMYEIAFKSKGYTITLTTDGLAWVTKAVTIRPDVIVLDIMMPNMDGFEVLQALRNNTSLHSLIITNSNLEGVDEEAKVKELGSDYFLRKSEYTPIDVVGFIEKLLQKT